MIETGGLKSFEWREGEKADIVVEQKTRNMNTKNVNPLLAKGYNLKYGYKKHQSSREQVLRSTGLSSTIQIEEKLFDNLQKL